MQGDKVKFQVDGIPCKGIICGIDQTSTLGGMFIIRVLVSENESLVNRYRYVNTAEVFYDGE